MTTETFPLQTAQAILSRQPFSELLGTRLVAFSPGEAILELTIEPTHLQQFGLVHGGVYAYLADNALTFAAGSVLGPSVVTTDFAVRYLRAARKGNLRAHAWVNHDDGRTASVWVEISVIQPEQPSTLCAIAQGGAVRTERAADGAMITQHLHQGDA